MADLAITNVVETGIDPTATEIACSAGGDKVVLEGGKIFLFVRVASKGGPLQVTITSQVSNPKRGTVASNLVVSVADNTYELIGPLEAGAYADTGDSNKAAITYDSEASSFIAAFRMP
jgi:hypothetical protein